MGYAKTKYEDPLQFVDALRKSSKVIFDNGTLKAEASRIQEKNSKRETMIRYFHKVNDVWVAFSFFCSNYTQSIIDDFLYECKMFKI